MPLQGCHVGGCSLTGVFEISGSHFCVQHAFQRRPSVVLAKSPAELRYIQEIGGGRLDPRAVLEAKRRELQNPEKSFDPQSDRGVCEAPGCRLVLKGKQVRFCNSTCQKRSWRSQQPKRSPRLRGRKRIYKSGADRVRAFRNRKRQAAQQAALEAERRLTPEDLRHKRNAEALAEKMRAEQRSRRAAASRRARSNIAAGQPWPWTGPTEQELRERDRLRRIDADPLVDEDAIPEE